MLASESLNIHQPHPLQNAHNYNESIFKHERTEKFDDVTTTELAQVNTGNKTNLLCFTQQPSRASMPNAETTLDIDTEKDLTSGFLLTEECTTTTAPSANILDSNNSTIMSKSVCNTNAARLSVNHVNTEVVVFIRECIEAIVDTAVLNGTKRSGKVVEWHSPGELAQLFDFKINTEAESHDKLLELLKQTIKYSVKTGHPYFINQLYSGVDPYALIGQWLTDALNPSVYTYEVAPVFTLMEDEVLSEMRRIVGFPNNGYGDGIFCPGGSIANGYAISCARFHKTPNSKRTGLFGLKRHIIFTSEDSHYSVEKLAVFMGMGEENVCKIRTNIFGKMDIEDLKAKVQTHKNSGCEPLMVSATAGTTVLGAFDDLKSIADICELHGMWFHVDAAWGGGALISQQYRHLLNGIERADSVTWNPHKMLTASQQCSTFLTKHRNILSQCHSSNATYLFQKDKFYDTSYDTGDKHIQCGRRADVFKFWFMWKAKGTKGLEEHVQQVFRMAEFLTAEIKKREGFELVLDKPECTNVCFWYFPPSLRTIDRDGNFSTLLDKVAPKIKELMIKKGSMMVTYQPLHNLPNFFRIVLQNPCLTENDMIYFLDEIERLGNSL